MIRGFLNVCSVIGKNESYLKPQKFPTFALQKKRILCKTKRLIFLKIKSEL